jgi:hypothetical protein
MTKDIPPTGPAELIVRSGKRAIDIAAEAGISLGTVMKCKNANVWPSHPLLKEALTRVLARPSAPASPASGDGTTDAAMVMHAGDPQQGVAS